MFRCFWAWLGALCACACASRSPGPVSSASPPETNTATMTADPFASPPALPPEPGEATGSELHGVWVPDPFRWLEDPSSERTQQWLRAQNDRTREVLDSLPIRARLESRFRELLYLDAVSPPLKRGTRYFFSKRTKDVEKSLLMVREADGSERILLNPNTMSNDGSVAVGDWFPSYDGRLLAYTRHENNADEAILYVRDVDTGQDLRADVIEGAKYAGPSWTPDASGFYYEWLPSDPSIDISERPGRTELRFHQIGTDPKKDIRVFPATRDPKTFLYGGVTRDGRWLTVGVQRGWNQVDLYIRDAHQPLQPVKEQPEAWLEQHSTRERVNHYAKALGFRQLAVGHDATFRIHWHDGSFYLHTNLDAPNYRVFRVDPQHIERSAWEEVVAEGSAKLNLMQVVGNRLVLSYLENASSRLEVRSLDGEREREIKLPMVGTTSGMVGNPDDDEAFFSFSSFTQPPQVFRTSVADGNPELWSEVKVPVDTSNVEVEQVWFPSKDGTKISMFLVHQKGLKLDGSHPTSLYGYGGFNISLTPQFSPMAAVWLEHGGVYAVANLRGGGEYGESWHRAGMLLNKQNVFDDFAAAARYLIDQGYTSPERLGIRGGSNGGLLVGAAMTQHPELFGAVVCAVPLLDMVRYHLFGSGRTWIEEYGSAEDEEQFRVLWNYSPYHHVTDGADYPALLMMGADSDDRVDPMHARKFTARVQAALGERAGRALFRLEENAGHGGGDMVQKQVESSADMTAFLLQALCPAGCQ